MSIKFESRSVNEAFARQAVGAFASQLDPTMEELGDIKTVVSEAVTNAIVHGYADRSGFIKAVRGFDPARGNEFSTYAVPKIAGEIRRFLRDDGAVKVSRAVKERAARVRRVQSELEGRLGRSPSVSELAAACALTPEEVAVCEQADVSVDSLERELSGGGRLGDLVGDEGMEERTCLYLSLEGALQSLPERERQVIALRFARDMTQQQVSRIIGVSQVQVSRIEKRALAALREKLCDT